MRCSLRHFEIPDLRCSIGMDVRTLLICAVFLLGVYAVTLLMHHLRQRSADGTGWLAGAYAAVAVGSGLGAARGYLPDLAAIVFAGTCVVLGHILLRRAICEFVGRSPTPAGFFVDTGLLAGSCAGLAYWTYVDPSPPLRILTVSLVPAFLAGSSALRLLRAEREPDTSGSESALGWVIAGLTVLLLLRSVIAVGGGPESDLLQAGWVQPGGILAAMLIGSSIILSFLWGTGARRDVALNRVAQLDPLTGLLNRRGFDRVARTRIEEAAANGQAILLFFADLDDLKRINDAHGHESGDRAICEAASVLRDVLRASDCLARLGGDEFSAVVPVRSPADGDVILRRLDQRLGTQNAQPGRRYTIGLTAAVLPFEPASGRPLPELLREVDQRMYAAKRERKRVLAG